MQSFAHSLIHSPTVQEWVKLRSTSDQEGDLGAVLVRMQWVCLPEERLVPVVERAKQVGGWVAGGWVGGWQAGWVGEWLPTGRLCACCARSVFLLCACCVGECSFLFACENK
jgi:hypothetical protein